ncbi:MAG: DUF748 domain-containing protein [Syntrophorhabdaceae bacterium]|nr:DUF748 domain-containing protein [Syntrophorhabdaceae bacterium]
MGKKKRIFIKIFLILCCLFLVFTLFGFFIAPPLLKSILIKNISKTLKRDVAIARIQINPLALTVKISGINIKERGKTDTMFSLDELFVNVHGSSIFKRALILNEIRLKKPYINIIRNKDGTYNFSDLMAMGDKKTEETKREPEKKEKRPFYFSLNNISLSDGSIDFYDGPANMKHTVRDMNIKIPFVSNLSHYTKTFIKPYFSASINDDVYVIQGDVKPFAETREAYINIDIKDLDIPKYLAYIPVKMNFKLLSGSLDVTAKVSFIEYKDKPSALVVSGGIAITKLSGDDLQKRLLFRLPSIDIDIKSLEPIQKTLEVSKVLIKSPDISIERDKEGVLNLQKIIEEKKVEKGKASEKEKGEKKTTEEKKEGQFVLNLNEVMIEQGKVSFNDLTTPQPVNMIIKNLELKAENISLKKNNVSKLFLSFLFDKNGAITLKGPFGIKPVFADLNVDIKNIHINTLQPYFTDKVNINITDGAFSTSGRFNLALPEKKAMAVKYNGKVLVSNLATIDKVNAEPLLNWKAFAINNLNFNSEPLSVHIDGISLADFFAKVTVNPDGTLNLQKIMVEEEKTKEKQAQAEQKPAVAPEQKPKEPEKDIKIGDITLQGGTIEFTDRAIQPSYTASLTEIGGKVSGIALKGDQLAELNLRGKINQFVPLEIGGKINPAKENLLVDLFVRFNSLDLSPMTPYSGKYIGYKVEKGKLSIDLKYLIAKRQLDSQNIIFIDQLTLGEPVDSPVATKLPVRLAIALLKDRNGQIKLDIPVSGSLDDPKFSVWRIVIQVLINLLTKAATAPFALLGSLFGGGEEISYVEFDYGDYKVNEQGMKKIENLAKALYERPSLKLDIQGHVDMDKDREGLKKNAFMRKLKVQKLNDMIKQGQKAVPLEEVKIEPNEYDKYLKMAYDAEKFAKPKTAVGLTKTLPASEMEKLIYTHIEIKDEDLRALANQRAGFVKESLLKTGKVTVDRVFIIEPKTLAPEKKDKLKDSRVDFSLK